MPPKTAASKPPSSGAAEVGRDQGTGEASVERGGFAGAAARSGGDIFEGAGRLQVGRSWRSLSDLELSKERSQLAPQKPRLSWVLIQ